MRVFGLCKLHEHAAWISAFIIGYAMVIDCIISGVKQGLIIDTGRPKQESR